MNIIFNYTDIKNCTAKCKLCERVIKTSGNSINLTSHLKNKNSDVFAKCAQKKLATNIEKVPTISESFKSTEAFKEDGYKSKEIADAIVYMICKDNIPVRCVEEEGFRGMLNKCVPHFKIPCRTKITTMIEDKYRQCVETVNAMLSAVPDVAFTCDAVTVPNSSRSFLTVTAHFVYKESLNTIRLNSTRMDQMLRNKKIMTIL
nr:E3 SUMO-protein ligase ZBED1-like [Drosophila suzukii]